MRTGCGSNFFPERKYSAAGEKVRGTKIFTDEKDLDKEFFLATPRQENPAGKIFCVSRESPGVERESEKQRGNVKLSGNRSHFSLTP